MCLTAEAVSVDLQGKYRNLIISERKRSRRCDTDGYIRHILRWSVQAQHFNLRKNPI